jgi:hypothetical protein
MRNDDKTVLKVIVFSLVALILVLLKVKMGW